MKIALVQQEASGEKQQNLKRGLEAAGEGATVVCFAELAFEPFYPQRPAEGGEKRLAEPVPGPISPTPHGSVQMAGSSFSGLMLTTSFQATRILHKIFLLMTGGQERPSA